MCGQEIWAMKIKTGDYKMFIIIIANTFNLFGTVSQDFERVLEF